MMEKMRTVLRIAAYCSHKAICLGAFGVGPIFRNPPRQVAKTWRDLLFHEEEFSGVFTDVVFAIEDVPSSSSKEGSSDHDIFLEEFDPSKPEIFRSSYR